MSTRTLKFPVIVLAALVCLVRIVAAQEDEPDPVLAFYWDKAAEAARESLPEHLDLSYRFTADLLYHHVNSDGVIVRTDTASIRYFYTGATQDSLEVVEGDGDRFKRFAPAFTDLLAQSFHLHFYPNDVGGPELHIGFRADSAATGVPDGMIVIGRRDHRLLRSYESYSDKPDYRRYSRFFRFADYDGVLVPDSVSEVATREGVFGLETYRVEAVIRDVEFDR